MMYIFLYDDNLLVIIINGYLFVIKMLNVINLLICKIVSWIIYEFNRSFIG